MPTILKINPKRVVRFDGFMTLSGWHTGRGQTHL